jgi:long-subunit fatty acid transport protein
MREMIDAKRASLRVLIATTAVVSATLALGSQAFASGFEKNIVLGGEAAGRGGIGTPSAKGADALFFNPAGLSMGGAGQDISLNLSPTWSTFKGPIDNQNTETTGAQTVSPIFGLMYGANLGNGIGFGFGGYVSGGAKTNYEDVPVAGYTGTPTAKTDLAVTEIAAGLGYQVMEGLNIGLAWRYVMAQADFATTRRFNLGAINGAFAGQYAIINPQLTGLKDQEALAFKFGAQYKIDEASNLSFVYRSEVNLEAKGSMGGKFITPTALQTVSSGVVATRNLGTSDATVKTTFPMAVTLGYDRKLNEDWSIFTEYVWTQYSRVGEIGIEGDIVIPSLTTAKASPIKTEWKDQHNVRLAAEYRTGGMPLRLGYVWTSQVTSSDYARATFTPPAPAHSLTAGTGTDFTMFGSQALFDLALEYTMLSGDGNGAAAGDASSDIRAGKYSTQAYALHAGLRYNF